MSYIYFFFTDKETSVVQTKGKPKLTERGKRELVHAERIARKLMGTPKDKQTDKSVRQCDDKVPRFVSISMGTNMFCKFGVARESSEARGGIGTTSRNSTGNPR